MPVTFFLEKAVEHLDGAGQARSRREYARVRWHLLKAAELLFKAAAQSSGRFRRIRLSRAEQLLGAARRLEGPARLRQRGEPEQAELEPPQSQFIMRERPEVTFDDVAGLEEAKQEIRLRMIWPLEHPEKATRYGIKRGGGLLLYGPPGTGKTLLARAVAGEVDAAFFTAKPSELMSKWVGEAEQNIQRLFQEARGCGRAVIFLDEVEALIPARRTSASSVMQRVVPQILAELQGVQNATGTVLFMGATNEPWAIDPAALRPGRFDAKLYVGLPDLAARRRLLELHLAGRPLADDVDLDRLAERLEGYSGADIACLAERCAAAAFVESIRNGTEPPIRLADVHAARQAVRPSVSSVQLHKYLQWGRQTQ